MTDATLSSLYPLHQIGSDGFNWWIGQVEQDHKKDPKGSGRCKVRIVGLHPQTCDIVDDEDLPWAITMMPVTNPHRPGATVSVSSQLKSGVWVVGFFLDNDKQQPVIIGSVGRVANSTKTKTEDKTTSEEGCNSFTTFYDDARTAADQNATDKEEVEVTSTDSGVTLDGKKRVNDKVISSSLSKIVKQKYSKNSTSNAAGLNFCVEKADKCGKESDVKGSFGRLISEMLYETQRNGGKLGNYLVGELSGGLYDAIDIGREYVDKAILLMKSFIAKVKGYVVKLIKKAVKKITKAILKPTDKGNRLTPVTKFLNDQLGKVGCEMADLGDRLAAWLDKVIFGYLFNIYKQTACQLDKFISGLINKIESLMNELLQSILGPLQSILGAIAAPLNMIGDAINYVLNLLGIKCSGPEKKCAKTTKQCTDCGSEKKENFLDELLKDLSNWGDSEDWNQYTCPDAQEGIKLNPTNVDFVGGFQKNPIRKIIYNIDDITVQEGEQAVFTVTRYGYTDIASSVTYKTRDGSAVKDDDYEESSGIVGFNVGETMKTISIRTFQDDTPDGFEDFFVSLKIDTPDVNIGDATGIPRSNFAKNIARCVIKENSISSGTTPVTPIDGVPVPGNITPVYNPESDPFTGNTQSGTETADEVTTPTYEVTSDKLTVKEGEFVTYSITTTNVPEGTTLEYQLFGTSIGPSDIIGNNLLGTFIIEDSSAKVIVGINKDNVVEDAETLIFAITGTGASASVLITSDISDLSAEEINEIEDQSSNDLGDFPSLLPTTGNPVTDKGGGIIQIPILTPGTAYTEPPKVFITGNGYGASGEVLLDGDGFATEIRIVDPGFGYKINLPTTEKVECIIDSFTMIAPGEKYTEVPTVFVDGDSNVAEAVINTKGQVVSVRIKNRTLTYDSYPQVKILGGGGYGAKFIPSFSCLSPEARVKVGSAKVGTGSYIDCP
jgi:hypothetical protein